MHGRDPGAAVRDAAAALFFAVCGRVAAAGCDPAAAGAAERARPAGADADAARRRAWSRRRSWPAESGTRASSTAMRKVPRHLFVDPAQRAHGLRGPSAPDRRHQTISQPYIVALMTELLDAAAEGPRSRDRHRLRATRAPFSESWPRRSTRSRSFRSSRGSARREARRSSATPTSTVREGDGYRGWPEHAPFDGIIVTAAPERIPSPSSISWLAGRTHGDPGRRLLPGAEGLHQGARRPHHRRRTSSRCGSSR